MPASSRSCSRARSATTSSTACAIAPLGPGEEGSRERARRLAEAKWTGNPAESIHDRWIDYELAGAADEDELDRILIDHLKRLGFGEDLYRFGLSGRVDPARQPELAAQIIEARTGLRQKLEAGGMADLVEPFDPERYNDQATVAENLLFGVPTSSALTGRRLAEHPGFRGALDRREPDGRPRRHGRAHRRDHDGDLPRPSARPSALRAVLLHRRRGARRVRGHRPAPRQRRPRRPPRRRHAPARPAARLYRAAPPPRPDRRRVPRPPRRRPAARAR